MVLSMKEVNWKQWRWWKLQSLIFVMYSKWCTPTIIKTRINVDIQFVVSFICFISGEKNEFKAEWFFTVMEKPREFSEVKKVLRFLGLNSNLRRKKNHTRAHDLADENHMWVTSSFRRVIHFALRCLLKNFGF